SIRMVAEVLLHAISDDTRGGKTRRTGFQYSTPAGTGSVLLAPSFPRSFIKQIHRHKIYKKALAF
ncbi:hypothetical protein J4X34_22560, partial [Escherichia coli]